MFLFLLDDDDDDNNMEQDKEYSGWYVSDSSIPTAQQWNPIKELQMKFSLRTEFTFIKSISQLWVWFS